MVGMCNFISVQDLKYKYRVYGHFYSNDLGASRIYPCRSVLEIVATKAQIEMSLATDLPDAVVVMMNPGSSSPEESTSCDSYNKNTIRNMKTVLCKAKPDPTQYQVMRIMDSMGWSHVRVINLSDLRTPKSASLYAMIKEIDNDQHSIFSESRKEELKSKLDRKPNAPIICAWGIDNALFSLCKKAQLSLSELPVVGWQKDKTNFKFYHANPQTQSGKQAWLTEVIFQLQKTLYERY
jgi:hypothetical protein